MESVSFSDLRNDPWSYSIRKKNKTGKVDVTFNALDWSLAFLAVFVLDFCWAFYVKRIQDSQAVKAGLWAALLFIVAAFATLFYVKDHWLIIPSAIGAFAGTAVAVWWDRRKSKTKLEEAISKMSLHNLHVPQWDT